LQQQQRIGRFIECCNDERPHQSRCNTPARSIVP